MDAKRKIIPIICLIGALSLQTGCKGSNDDTNDNNTYNNDVPVQTTAPALNSAETNEPVSEKEIHEIAGMMVEYVLENGYKGQKYGLVTIGDVTTDLSYEGCDLVTVKGSCYTKDQWGDLGKKRIFSASLVFTNGKVSANGVDDLENAITITFQ